MNFENLKLVKEGDTKSNRLTYLVPKKSFDSYMKDELMWVKRFENEATVVFRCLDDTGLA